MVKRKPKEQAFEQSPEQNAGILSLLTLQYFNPVLKIGAKDTLQEEHLYPLLPKVEADHVADKFEELFVFPHVTGEGEKIGIAKSLYYLIRGEFWLAGISALMFASMPMISPVLLNQVIKFLMSYDDPNVEPLPEWHGILYAIALSLTLLLATVFNNQQWRLMGRGSVGVHAALTTAMYRKSLRLSNEAYLQCEFGKVVNLMAVDTEYIFDFMPRMHDTWTTGVQLIVSLVLLFYYIGVYTFVGLGVQIFVLPVMVSVVVRISKATKKRAMCADSRLKATTDAIMGVRAIKAYAWEPFFLSKVTRLRAAELKQLRSYYVWQGVLVVVLQVTTPLIALATFATFSAAGNDLDAATVFTTLALFQLLSTPLARFPLLLSRLVTSNISLHRIRDFLLLPEKPPAADNDSDLEEDVVIELTDASFAWNPSKLLSEDYDDGSGESEDRESFTLNDVNVTVERGSLTMIVGPVGCGKSMLINAMLGNVPQVDGAYKKNVDKIAYVPQEAFIANRSLKDNVLFGQPYKKQRYQHAISVTSLEEDIEILESGAETEIGEKGVNISGGQKQRVSLARAVYQDCDVYFLDDPLSAVDSHTGAAIFNECIVGALADKTRVMVTNQMHYFEHADNIVVLENGRVREQGTYDELLEAGLDFADLVAKHGVNDDEFTEETTDSTSDVQLIQNVERTGKGQTLVEDEERAEGTLSSKIFIEFFRNGGFIFLFMTAVLSVLTVSTVIGTQVWLALWTEDTDNTWSNDVYITGYAILTVIGGTLVLSRELSFVSLMLGAVRKLHYNTLRNVLHLPSSFFDATPLGRVLNRFAKDMSVADTRVVFGTRFFVFVVGNITGALIFASVITRGLLVIVIVIAGFLFYRSQSYFRKSGRAFQRLEAIANSPVIAHFSESLSGRSTIMAFGTEDKFLARNSELINRHHRAYYLARIAPRWLDFRLGMLSALLVLALALFVVLARDRFGDFTVSILSLALQQVLSVIPAMSFVMILVTEIEVGFTNVERIQYYGSLPSELDDDRESVPPAETWPENGKIVFKNVYMRYRAGLENALDGVSFTVKSGEKVGIVGRSGAGKSSLSQVLLRLTPYQKGKIIVAGQEAQTIPFSNLRGAMFTIPQTPVLFEGTIRFNLDPLEKSSDTELWDLLRLIQLDTLVASQAGKLDHPVSEGGSNFSVGERQLFCFARALNAKAKMLIMDEATASVDVETDEIIQRVVREQFRDCTILTIAHRLNTIIDSDKILVMEQGRAAEFDTPEALFDNKSSLFYKLAKDAGIRTLKGATSSDGEEEEDFEETSGSTQASYDTTETD